MNSLYQPTLIEPSFYEQASVAAFCPGYYCNFGMSDFTCGEKDGRVYTLGRWEILKKIKNIGGNLTWDTKGLKTIAETEVAAAAEERHCAKAFERFTKKLIQACRADYDQSYWRIVENVAMVVFGGILGAGLLFQGAIGWHQYSENLRQRKLEILMLQLDPKSKLVNQQKAVPA